MQGAEFIRGNQKSFIRISCDEKVLQESDYQMCLYNKIGSLLEFGQRSQNGTDYLYYEISGMQSLDVYLQTQKMRRSFAVLFVQAIVDLCKEISEYALDIRKIIFSPRYIMISGNEKTIRFVYCFDQDRSNMQELEELLEGCIEYLDYQDDLLMEKLYNVYERLLDQKENFSLSAEMESLYQSLVGISESTFATNLELDSSVEVFGDDQNAEETSKNSEKRVRKNRNENYNLKRGAILLLLLDAAVLFFWKPITLLKIFFAAASGIVLLFLQLHLYKRDKKRMENREQQSKEKHYIEEYEELTAQSVIENNYTQIILIEDSEGVLYNLQESEPKYIYIDNTQKIIGKDSEKVQVQILQEGISRIHALVQKEGESCIVEDLNSTNGTWINGQALVPRSRYVLKPGDKVRFAGAEYIFR